MSHSSRDEAVSRQVVGGLRDEGFAALFVDFDPELGIPAGRQWERELYGQLRKADAVVFLASPASVASQWCVSELVLARSLGKPIFPLLVERTDMPWLLSDVQWVDASVDRQSGLRRLCDGLRRSGLDPTDSFAWDSVRSPYPGLAAFDERDAAVFFGRDAEIAKLLELLQPTLQRDRGRFLMVVGPSGSGKSSLVRAGLIPRLRRAGHGWLMVPVIVPGDRPAANLARSLAVVISASAGRWDREAIEHRLEEGNAVALVDVLRDLHEMTQGTFERSLLVIDQAEELVTRCGEVERRRFLSLLQGALLPDSPLWVVAVARSEFLSRLITDADIADVVDEPFVVGPLSRSRLPEVIARPARRAGLEFAPGLIERMAADTAGGRDALPLLAYTLARLYQRAGPGRELTGEDYDAVGTVIGALTHQADRVTLELTARGLGSAVMPTLLRLASVDAGEPISRRVPKSGFTGDAAAVVDAFVDARLLTTVGEADDATVEVAHEALLRQWTPLRDRIEASRHELQLRADIARMTGDWDSAHRDESYLLRGVRLAQAKELGPDARSNLDEAEQAYIAASEALAARENRRLRRGVAALAALLLASFVAAGVAIHQTDVANTQTAAARSEALVARSRQLAAQANVLLDSRPHAGLLVALEAAHMAPTDEALGALEAGLRQPIHPTVAPLTGHQDWVRAVAFSPDGGTLASASDDETVRLWDVATGLQRGRPLTGHKGWVWGVAYSRDGVTLASAGQDGTVRLWNTKTGEPRAKPLTGHHGPVLAVALSRDGATLASAGSDGTVRLWDTTSGLQRGRPMTGHIGPVWAVAFTRDGTTLASAGNDGTVRLWDTTSGQLRGEPLTGHDGPVRGLAFSGDGAMLASAGEDRTVWLWHTNRRRPRGESLTGHDGAVWAVAFSRDGTMLASAGDDRTVRLWDMNRRRPRGEPLTGQAGTVRGLAFSPDGLTLALAGEDRTVRLWGTTTRQQIGGRLLGHDSAVTAVGFGRDGTTLASAGDDRTVRLWDVDRRRLRREPLVGHDDAVRAVTYSHDGLTLASAGLDRTVRLWNAATGRQLGGPLTGHDGAVWDLAFSPNGVTLASAGQDGTVRLWNAATGRQLGRPLTGHEDWVRGLAFSPDGVTLASAGDDGTLRLWIAATGRQLGRPLTGHDGAVRAVAFSPDGVTLASAGDDGTVRLWNAATGRQLGRPLTGHAGAVANVAFSRDGVTLASAGEDGTVQLWDARTRGQLVKPLTGHDGAVWGLAFGADGTTLASAGADTTVRLWSTPASWVAAACDIAGRNLSQREWNILIGTEHPYVRLCPGLPPGPSAPDDAKAATYGHPLHTDG